MSDLVVSPEVVQEETTVLCSGVLTDERGVALGSAQLTACTLLMYLVDGSGLFIIGTLGNPVNILNVGRGVVDASGNIEITLTPADNDIVGAGGGRFEVHEMLVEWTYAAGVKKGKQRVRYQVENLSKVV